jgi:hypothetical protein
MRGLAFRLVRSPAHLTRPGCSTRKISPNARAKSYIGGTTPLPNNTAPASSVPSGCFSVGTKTCAPGSILLGSCLIELRYLFGQNGVWSTAALKIPKS